jgi:hypothetical protein
MSGIYFSAKITGLPVVLFKLAGRKIAELVEELLPGNC